MAYLLDLFRHLDQQYKELTRKVRELAQTENCRGSENTDRCAGNSGAYRHDHFGGAPGCGAL